MSARWCAATPCGVRRSSRGHPSIQTSHVEVLILKSRELNNEINWRSAYRTSQASMPAVNHKHVRDERSTVRRRVVGSLPGEGMARYL
jgi:hypothetical protein